MGLFATLDEAYERHAIAEQRLRLAGNEDDAEVHHRMCVVILAERIANEDAHKTPLPPIVLDCNCRTCHAAYGIVR